MIVKISKTLTFDISINLSGMSHGKKFIVELKDNATFVEALAMVDKQDLQTPEDSIFPIFDGYIHNYLQLFWNPREDKIYEDVGINAYGPDDEGRMTRFMPLRDDINYNLLPDSVIGLQPDSGC